MRTWVQSLALFRGLSSSIAMSSRVGCRHGWDPALLWLWCRPAATVPIGPLAWEPPYDMGAALEKAKIQKKKAWEFSYTALVALKIFFKKLKSN